MGLAPNIPLSGIPTPQPQGPLDMAQKGLNVQALINAVQRQKTEEATAQLQQQQEQIKTQQAQQEFEDSQKFRKAFLDNGGDWQKTIDSSPANGVGPQFLIKAQIARTDQLTKYAAMDKELLANEMAKSNALGVSAQKVIDADPIANPAQAAKVYAQERNTHLASNAYKASEIPEQMPSLDELKETAAHSKANQDMLKEAITLQEQKAKLPGEQAEATAKQYTTGAQTMAGAQDQLSWTARRNLAVKNDKGMESLIPETYSPQAAEQVRQLGISPKDLAEMSPDKLELRDFMKNPPAGYPPTPVGFLKFKSDQTANAQVRAVQMLTGNTGGGGGGAPQSSGISANTPATPTNAPGGWVGNNGRTLNAVSPMLRDRVKAILEYRQPDPPQGARGPVPQALANLVAEFDPNHDATTYPTRNQAVKDFTKDASTGQIGAINTALGHSGDLYTAAKTLDGSNLPLLHSLQAKFGLVTGDDAASTYKMILHRLGPEMTSAYIKGGGTKEDRGANESDFDISLGQKQILSNIAESAQLLNSKLDSKRQAWNNSYKPYRDQDQFDNRFITPAAQQTLTALSSQAPTNKATTQQHTAGGKASGLTEGQTGTGSDGKKYIVKGGVWVPK